MSHVGYDNKQSVFMSLVGGGGSLLLGTIPAILYVEPFGRRFLGLRHATGLLHPPAHHWVFLPHRPRDQRQRRRRPLHHRPHYLQRLLRLLRPPYLGPPCPHKSTRPVTSAPTYGIGIPRTSRSSSAPGPFTYFLFFSDMQ